jgi:hypothetical protein
MEGPCLRAFPRTLFSCPVAVRSDGKTLRLEEARGNLSLHGLCLHADGFAVNTHVRVKLDCTTPLQVEGIVRYCDGNGLGIEFQPLSRAKRERLCQLIAEFMPREVLAAENRATAGAGRRSN